MSEAAAVSTHQPASQSEVATSSIDLIRLEEQRRFERFFYLSAVGMWLTSLLLVGVVYSLSDQARRTAWLWAGAVTTLMMLTVISWRMLGQHLVSMDARDAWHKVFVVLHGLMWALVPFLFFEPAQPLLTMFMVCMLCGMSAAGVPVFGTRPVLYVLTFVPPFIAQIIVFGGYGLRTGDTFHALLGAAMLLLLSVNLIFSRFTWSTLNRSIVLAYENQELVQQLKIQAVQLSESTRTAQEANTAKTKFLAAASHDLRQPVHALNLFVEVLSGTPLDEKQTTMVQHIRAASLASREMLNTLLDYSRIEAGVMTPKPRPTPLAPLLRTLEDEFGPQADGRKLVYRTRDTDCMAMCDPTMTALVLRNFVSNALRYTQEGGILVCARRRGVQVIVQVMDTGVGIAPEHREEVFKEFRQLGNEERDRQKGLGLGLAIAKGLAQSMGARIELSSRLGHGSVFTLCLPAIDTEGGAITAVAGNQYELNKRFDNSGDPTRPADWLGSENSPSKSSPVQATPILRGKKVLVVDDESAVRLSMKVLLQSWDCQVRVAEGMEEVQDMLSEEGFALDLLITDYRLRAGLTGGDVIAAVRQKLRTQTGEILPAIIITGDTAPERIRDASSYEATTLLHKPVSTATLQDGMRQIF